ncbi:MAG TPA: hypothetical protein VIL74_05855 [Pyrinomonadaceae bacterium]
MRGEATYKSENCRKTAQILLTEVDKLVSKAGQTTDKNEQRELYLRAMGISNEAYSLLARARNARKKAGEKTITG